MRSEMSTKERILTAVNCREPDHIPFLSYGGIPYRYWWNLGRDQPFRDQFERVVETLRLGIDDAVYIHSPIHYNQKLKVRVRKEEPSTEPYPLLIKEYETPKGILRKVVRQTQDWPHEDDIPIISDYAVSHSVKNWVEDPKDLEALSCLFREPTDEELKIFEDKVELIRNFAEKYDVPIISMEDANLGGMAMWLCGFMNVAISSMKNQGFLHELLDIIHGWDMIKVRYLLEFADPDIIVHYGWYDSTEFWSLKTYRTFLLPRLQEEIELVHRYKKKFGYTMASGAMPLLGTFREMGIDLLYGIDPVQGGYDMTRTKQEIGDRICLWGGVNSHVTLTLGSREDVKKAVKEAITKLSPNGGFILSNVGSMRWRQIPIANIEAMIEAWRDSHVHLNYQSV